MNDDLISRQAVLDILEKEGHKWGNDYRDWVDAVNEVETLPPVNPQEPKWILVSEGFPKDEDYVLVCYADGSIRTAYYYIDTESEDKE